jgi:hypothetical protein
VSVESFVLSLLLRQLQGYYFTNYFRETFHEEVDYYVNICSVSTMAVDYQPPQCLSRPIEVPSKLLMGAGPSNAAENVLKAGSLPLLGHLHTEFIQVLHFFFKKNVICSDLNKNVHFFN